MSEDLRAQLRALTVGTRKPRSRFVEHIDEDTIVTHVEMPKDPEGPVFEVREPSVTGTERLRKAATVEVGAKKGADGEVDVKVEFSEAKMKVHAVIECTYVPGTEQRVYELADEPVLLHGPNDALFSALVLVALGFVNGTLSSGKASGKTPASSPDASSESASA